MIFYMVPATGSQPAKLAPTQAIAREACLMRNLKPRAFEEHEVPTDKAGLMNYINNLMERDNSARDEDRDDPLGDGEEYGITQPITDVPPPVDPLKYSIAIDDAWEGLPLARKLHFASLAMEDARRAL